jgi:hypothetical protein
MLFALILHCDSSSLGAFEAEVAIRQGDQYNVIVRIGLAKYRGSFNTLAFRENKPSRGFCHEGRLDLVFTTKILALKQDITSS